MSEHNPFNLADIWLNSMKQANKYGLEAEVTQFALENLGITEKQLDEALWDALCEWDI